MSEAGYRCVCLNARSIVNKKNELNIMVEDIDPHIIGITESWANTDITDAELGLTEEGEGELFHRLKNLCNNQHKSDVVEIEKGQINDVLLQSGLLIMQPLWEAH